MLKLYIAGNLGFSTSQSILVDPTKINAFLTTGGLEILDKHTDLIGIIASDLVSYSFLKDNKIETKTFFFRLASFWVGNNNVIDFAELAAALAGLKTMPEKAPRVPGQKFDTTVVVYGEYMVELNSMTPEEPHIQEMEKIKRQLDKENEIVSKIEKPTDKQLARQCKLKKEYYSSLRLLSLIKEYRKSGK